MFDFTRVTDQNIILIVAFVLSLLSGSLYGWRIGLAAYVYGVVLYFLFGMIWP